MIEKIAKIEQTFLGWEDHGIFTATLILDYGGSGQGTPAYSFGTKEGTAFGCNFIMRLMQACGANEWSQIKGTTILALFEDDTWSSPLVGIKPLPTEKGREFLFKELMDRG